MDKLMQLGLAVALAAVVAGCGALFNSGPAHVMFTSTPAGAEVWIDGMRRGTTPTVVDLQKDRDHTVVFRKAGYADVSVMITKKLAAGYVILDVLGGLVPIIIDAATGSWFVLSTDAVHGTLDPVASGPTGMLTPEQLEQVRQGVPASRFIELPETAVKETR